jgi:hypothetical protein
MLLELAGLLIRIELFTLGPRAFHLAAQRLYRKSESSAGKWT